MSENEEKDPATWEQELTNLGTKASEQLDSLAEKSKGWGEDLLKGIKQMGDDISSKAQEQLEKKEPDED
jgi:hypothetical protein